MFYKHLIAKRLILNRKRLRNRLCNRLRLITFFHIFYNQEKNRHIVRVKTWTIKDLAQLLNVSPSTISRALNNHPDISIEMRNRVQQLAEELQFKPNSFAANFRKKQTKLIAIILPKIYHSFIPDVIEGITKRLNAEHFQTLVLITEDQLQKEIEAITQCCDMRIDGILLSVSNQTKDLRHLEPCKKMGISIVLFDNILETNEYSTVHIDEIAAAKQCAIYINEQNCLEVAAIYGPDELSISQKRKLGFNSALDPQKKIIEFHASNSREAYEFAEQQIRRNPQIAFFGITDEVLHGIVKAIKEHDLSKSCTVIGFSDGLTLPFLHRELRYIFHNGKNIGSAAAEQILNCINGKDSAKLHLEIPVQLC